MVHLSLKKIRQIFIGLTVLCLTFFMGYRAGGGEQGIWSAISSAPTRLKEQSKAKEQADFGLFWVVWDKMKKGYIDQKALDDNKMVYGAIKGMVGSSGDPYTVFLTPEENKRAKDDLEGSFEGVGIQLGYKEENQLAVVAPLAGMPAEKAGVKAGDLILKIDGEETTGLSLPEAVEKIRGPRGTTVSLELLSEDSQDAREVKLTRDVIMVPSVELKWVAENEKVAHLKVNRFGEQTRQEWDKVVNEILQTSGVRGMVLDLRGNPGGYFLGAIDLASDLVEGGVIVQEESANGDREQFRATGKARLYKLPLTVLIDEGSASAAEIMAGALQELREVKLVGQKTFGKGSVQETVELDQGSGLHITTYRWLLPSGKSIDKTGIEPDVAVEQDEATVEVDEQLQEAIKLL